MVKNVPFHRQLISQIATALKPHWQALVQTNAAPQNIALAFAIGTFISVLPTPGLNLLLVTFLASLFKQLNRAGLLAAIAVWNTLVVAPLYFLSHKIGELLFHSMTLTGLQEGADVVAVGFIVGNLLLAVGMTAVSFFLVQTAMSRYQTRMQPCQ